MISMKYIIPILLLLCCGCAHNPLSKPGNVIAIQPLNGFNKQKVQYIREELARFYHKNIIILPERSIPESFINNTKGKRYDAGKIIEWLSASAKDSILSVVGLTSEDIYTTKLDKEGRIKKPESTYAVWGIFGLGYRPGKSCIIADHRLLTGDEQKSDHRLRTVTIHEIGHNLGLQHCVNKGCIMSDANEKITTVDQSGNDYCRSCNQQAGRQGN